MIPRFDPIRSVVTWTLCLLMSVTGLSAAGAAAQHAVVSIRLSPRAGRPVVVRAEVAATDAARARGLMDRRQLPEGRGMWFVFATDVRHPFWMKDTYIPLDLIFVGADWRIVDIISQARPLAEMALLPRGAYRYVLEVRAGFAARHRLRPGDRVLIDSQ